MSAINITPISSLVKWLATFKLDGKDSIHQEKDASYSLADGFICARILNQISPLYFTDKWLDGIKPVPPNGSWRLRVSNLKRILQKIHDYASDLQSPQFRSPSTITPDVVVIAQNFDPDQIDRLIQLILLCAINCEQKQEYIEKIRQLPTEVKQDIKEAIEELLVKNDDSVQSRSRQNSSNDYEDNESASSSQRLNLSTSSQNVIASPARASSYRTPEIVRRNSSQSESLRKNDNHLDTSQNYYSDQQNETIEEIRHKLSAAMIVSDEKAQACHELESKLKQVQMERDQLAFENERLVNHNSSTPMKNSDSRRQSRGNLDINVEISSDNNSRKSGNDEDMSHDLVLQQNRRLQTEVQRLKEDIMKIETEKEDYRLKSNLLIDDLNRISLKHEELRDKAERAKRLQDELDEHKQISEKVAYYESTLDNLVKKNTELKRDIKSHEDKNLTHVQNIVKLEEENHQLKSNISQIEIYKKQLNETRIKLSEETHRADKAEVEQARLSEKLESTKRDCEKLLESTYRQSKRSNSSGGPEDLFPHNRNFDLVDLKDGLPASNSGDNFKHHLDQGDINSSIPISTIDLKEKIARLEAENGLLQGKLSANLETNRSALSGLLEEANEKCKKLENDNRLSRKKIMMLESSLRDLMGGSNQQIPSTSGSAAAFQPQDSSSDNVLALIKRVEDLQRTLFQREQELRDLDAKYKKNTLKAKELIMTLNSQHPMGGSLHPSGISLASSFNSNSLDEISLLKQQLREREELNIELERESYEYKKVKEVHERLILSAFYGLTTQLQWKNAEKRLERTTLTSPPNTTNSSISINSKHSH